jgi:hypothetical protein
MTFITADANAATVSSCLPRLVLRRIGVKLIGFGVAKLPADFDSTFSGKVDIDQECIERKGARQLECTLGRFGFGDLVAFSTQCIDGDSAQDRVVVRRSTMERFSEVLLGTEIQIKL